MDISLVLGAGGVKGFAHIGVLRVLERHGFRVRAVAGSSIGGIAGAGYCLGLTPDEIESRMRRMDQKKFYGRLPGDGPAMMGVAGLVEILNDVFGDMTFEELPLPFAVNAVDMETAEEVVFGRGRIVDAILATTAVPGMFPPRKFNDQILVDGGVLNPVPVSLARSLAPGLPVVAVVLSPSLEGWVARPTPRLLGSVPLMERTISHLRPAQALDIFLRSVDMASCLMADLRLQIDQPEVVIRPKIAGVGLIDEVNVEEMVKRGEAAAEMALPELRRAAGWRAWISRRLPWGSVLRSRNSSSRAQNGR